MQAAGHVYKSESGHGIEWNENEARLWQDGSVIARAAHNADSARAYWYSFAFARDFPQVTHWWFGSSWTQAVRVSLPQGMLASQTSFGTIQFMHETQPRDLWTVYRDTVSAISVPAPPFEAQNFAANVPLHRQLMQMVVAMLLGNVQHDQWYTVSSLVAAKRLPAILDRSYHRTWRAERYYLPLRDEWCNAMGLHAPITATTA